MTHRSFVAVVVLVLVASASLPGRAQVTAPAVTSSYPTPLPAPTPIQLQAIQLQTPPPFTRQALRQSATTRQQRKAAAEAGPNRYAGNEAAIDGTPQERQAALDTLYARRTAETANARATERNVVPLTLRVRQR